MKRGKKEDNSNHEGGNFWTSYSDMLLGLSVVFLVLFFVSTLRSGVEQLKMLADKQTNDDYLKGMIPKEVAEKNEATRSLAEQKLKEIEDKKKMLARDMEAVKSFVKNLDSQKNVIDDLLKDQLDKNKVIQSANLNRQKLEKEVSQLAELKKKLQEEVKTQSAQLARITDNYESLKNVSAIELSSTKAAWQKEVEHIKKITSQEIEETKNKWKKDVDWLKAKSAKEIAELQASTSKELKDTKDKWTKDVNFLKSKAEKEITAYKSSSEKELAETKDKWKKDVDFLRAKSAKELASVQSGYEKQIGDLKASSSQELAGVRAGYEKELKGLKGQIGKMGGELESKGTALKSAQGQIAGLHGEIEGLKGKLKGKGGEVDGLNKQIGELNGQIGGLNKKIGGLNGEIEGLKGKLGGKGKEIEGLNGQIAGLKGEIGGLKGEIGQLNGKLGGRDKRIGELEKQLADGLDDYKNARGKLASAAHMIVGLRDDLNDAKKKFKNCDEEIAALKKDTTDKQRKLASMDGELKKAQDKISELGKQRKAVATGIRDNLRAQGLDADLDSTTGVLTLAMDEAFQFKNGSYEISDRAKEKLKVIIPIYAKNLFDKISAQKIASLNIVGHASPTHRNTYVDPEAAYPEAIDFNQKLSEKRAEQIAQFMFSDEIGDYPYKKELHQLVKSKGMGFSSPIKSADAAGCGPYDCIKSRRVEISFLLKGEFQVKRVPSGKN